LIFLYLGNPFALVICVFMAISIIYLKHHYINKPIILNISSIYHFKICEIKHRLHTLLVIIVNLLENDYVNQIIDCLSNITILKSWGVTILAKFTIHNHLKKNSNAQNVEKNTITRKGKNCQCFICEMIRCLNLFIFTTFCSNTYK